ncbi:hypothetical protein K9N50_10730 [bacterium]|nr:hypothetical protein [bacterium]
MPTLPKYERKEIPGVVPGVRADPGAMTQDLGARARMGGALANTGFALTDVGIKFQQTLKEAEEVSQFSKASTTYENELNAWSLEYGKQKVVDQTKAAKDYADAEKKIREKAGGLISQPNAYDSFNRFADKNGVVRQKSFFLGIDTNRREKVEADTKFSLDSLVANAIADGDPDMTQYDKLLSASVAAGIYSEGVAGSLRLAAEAKIKIGIKQKEEAEWKTYKDAVYNGAVESPSYEIAEDYVKNAGLGDETGKMLRDIKTHYETQEAKKIKEDKLASRKWTIEHLDKMNSLELTVEQIKTMPDAVDNPEFWYKALNDQNDAIRKKQNLPYTEDNGKAIADILLMNADPNQKPLTETDILNRVAQPNTYSLKTATNLIKASDVTETTVFKNTDASLKTLFGYEGLLRGFGSKPLGRIYYNNAMVEILADQAENPLKGAELRNRIYEIAEPYLRQHWESSGETEGDIDMRMKAMGIKVSPVPKIVPPPKIVTPPPVSGYPKKKDGETEDQYLKRIGL